MPIPSILHCFVPLFLHDDLIIIDKKHNSMFFLLNYGMRMPREMASLPSPPHSLPLRYHHRTQSLPPSATPCTLPRTRPRSSLSSPSRDGTPPLSPLSRRAALPTPGAIEPSLPVRSPIGSDRVVLLSAEATRPISSHRQIHKVLPSRHRIWVS
jgi:hypothetical protein